MHCNGTDIAHWHQLTINPETGCPRLSSRRLLVLLEHLPDTSAFKTAAERGGRWPDWKQMLSEIANEGYRFRASYHAVHSTDDHDATFDPSQFEFVDPAVRRQLEEQAKQEAEVAAQTEPELAEAGWM